MDNKTGGDGGDGKCVKPCDLFIISMLKQTTISIIIWELKQLITHIKSKFINEGYNHGPNSKMNEERDWANKLTAQQCRLHWKSSFPNVIYHHLEDICDDALCRCSVKVPDKEQTVPDKEHS